MKTTDTIEIPKSIALSIFHQLGEYCKPLLDELNASMQIPEEWDEIKCFEQALMVSPATEDEIYILKHPGTSNAAKASVAHTKLSIIARAMNKLNNNGEEWVPDWTNSNQYKYYPWLEYKAGSGFSSSLYVYGSTTTLVGSRLCFMTSDMAKHAGTQFNDLYNQLFTL
jgi:hypothetical protein